MTRVWGWDEIRLRIGVGVHSQPISTAQSKAPTPRRIPVGSAALCCSMASAQHCVGAQHHSHTAPRCSCWGHPILQPLPYISDPPFSFGKKTQPSKSKDKSAPGRGEGGAHKAAAPKSHRSAMQSHALQTLWGWECSMQPPHSTEQLQSTWNVQSRAALW